MRLAVAFKGAAQKPGAGRFETLHGGAASVVASALFATLVVFLVECITRGSLSETLAFLTDPTRPAWTTIAVITVAMLALDGFLGRKHNGFLVIAPTALILAFVAQQKRHYLGDPLYPADFLYSRQIVELLPLLVRERPVTAALITIGLLAAVAGLLWSWRFWRRHITSMSPLGRALRLTMALPLLAGFASMMDYATFSWMRDRLRIIPMMWDQTENYRSNGFTLAFALNLPMAKVGTPPGYSSEAIASIPTPQTGIFLPVERPDIIMVMSESFWDVTGLPNTEITPDPIPFMRANRSGSVFSPEFGGMTANVEFEALTGFSNAFLPSGSIPYQQYIRRPMPSLATFLRAEGYETKAIHPFAGWFWNRSVVYKALGFADFRSEEALPQLKKRGPLVSDAALMSEIMREADREEKPFFYFAVTLQGHGPYPPHRYGTTSPFTVDAKTNSWAQGSIDTYAQGSADADSSLRKLVAWAKKRKRPTVIAFFGDHLPPLGEVYTQTGFMDGPVAPRRAPRDKMLAQHETPLLIWSNNTGTERRIGTISPAFLPLHVLEAAGIGHPFYTDFLGHLRERFPVIDRNLLLTSEKEASYDWLREPALEPDLNAYRLLQYDMMFGDENGKARFFPETLTPMIAESVLGQRLPLPVGSGS